MLLNMKSIYFLTDKGSQHEYEVDPRVTKIYCDDLKDIPDRSYHISLQYKKINPDIVILEDHSSIYFYHDILTLKMCGAYIIGCEHGEYFISHTVPKPSCTTYHRAIMQNYPMPWWYSFRLESSYLEVARLFQRSSHSRTPILFRKPTAKDSSSLEDKNILFIGRLTREKQPAEALRVFSVLADVFSDWNLLMPGTGRRTFLFATPI